MKLGLNPALWVLCSLSVACGGEVDLGGRANSVLMEPEAAPPGAVESEEAGEALAQVSTSFLVSTMAVAGDFLFLSVWHEASPTPAVLRCDKRSCPGTVQFMNVTRQVVSMQSEGEGLGVASCTEDDCWLGVYELPNLDAQSVAIEGLPRQASWSRPVFHDGSVFWSLMDEGVYRCRLPQCGDGPERVSTYDAANNGPLRATSNLLFWTDGYHLYRAADLGAGPTEILITDESLSVVSERGSDYDIADFVAIDGKVYVASRPIGCGTCGYSVTSWPALGGRGTVLLESTRSITELAVQGKELAWVEADGDALQEGTLFTCLYESCAATRRRLGPVAETNGSVVSDGRDWYWHRLILSWSDESHTSFHRSLSQLRRVPLLPHE